jgi:hypothetical protein
VPLLDGTDPLTDGAPELEIPAAAEPEPEQPGKLISVDPEGGKPKSRRQIAEEQRSQEISGLRTTLEELRAKDSQRDQVLAELRGMMAGQLQRPVVVQQAPAQQTRGAGDPSEVERLEEAAMKALDAKDFTAYHRNLRAAHVLAATEAVEARQQQNFRANPQPQGPAAMPQELIPLFAAHPEVASHPSSVNLLMAKAVEAEARGIPAGPQRSQWVFTEVSKMIKERPGSNGASFDTRSKGALSGVPTTMGGARTGGGNGQAGVTLTADERAIAKMAGMSDAEYAADVAKHDPKRIER